MEESTIGCLFLLALLHTVQSTFHSREQPPGAYLCQVANGDVGTCTYWKSCYGASRKDKGNSNDCRWWQTCCMTYVVDKSVQHRSRHSNSDNNSDRVPRTGNRPLSPTSSTPQSVSSSSSTSSGTVPNLRIKGCGVRKVLRDFIVGGQQAEYWPWMAAIFFRPQGARMSAFQCGGTIISKRYILTAAHCLIDGGRVTSPARVTVRMGGLTPQGSSRIHRVEQIIIHNRYRNRLHYDDIALLRLNENIESKNVVPVCLPTPGMVNSNFYQKNGTVTGWGIVDSSTTSLSKVLREVKIPIVSNSRCNRRYQRLAALSLPRGIIDTQLCAGSANGTVDACQGDSGGPLVLEDRSKKWNIIGIVSFGFGCGEPEYPGVYTRVTKYLPWLYQNTDISANS